MPCPACGSTALRDVTDQSDSWAVLMCGECGRQGPEADFAEVAEPPEPRMGRWQRVRSRLARLIHPTF